jgi:hypothetical protein
MTFYRSTFLFLIAFVWSQAYFLFIVTTIGKSKYCLELAVDLVTNFGRMLFGGSVPLSGPKPLWAYHGMIYHMHLGGTRKLSNSSIVQM